MVKIIKPESTDFNPERARTHLERYIREKSLTHPEMHFFTKSGNLTAAGIASFFKLDDRTARNLLRCLRDPSQGHALRADTFMQMCKETKADGITNPRFWMGVSEEPDREKYEEQQSIDAAFSMMESRQAREHLAAVRECQAFFRHIGYEYEDRYAPDDPTTPPHVLRREGEEQFIPLTDDQMTDLLNRLSDVTEFTLWKMRKGGSEA